MPKDNSNQNINFLGVTTFRNARRRFGIKEDDRRRHVYIMGKTGMGKTAMMENMAIQDIMEGRGSGLCRSSRRISRKSYWISFLQTESTTSFISIRPTWIIRSLST